MRPDNIPPEVWVDCPECGGAGEFTVNDPPVSRWSIDPPGVHEVPCETCGGAGGMICEPEGSSLPSTDGATPPESPHGR